MKTVQKFYYIFKGHIFWFSITKLSEHYGTGCPPFEEKEKEWFEWRYNSNGGALCSSDQEITKNLYPHCVCHWFMKIKPLVLTLKANKSQLSPNCPLLSGYSRIVLIAVFCLGFDDAEVVTGQRDRQVEGCYSHLLIVTGRGWTPARKEAIISLSSTARWYYCKNFNRATKSVLQGQIKKSMSKPQHTEDCVLVY